MIDSIDLYSVPISEELAAEIEALSIKKTAKHNELILYEFSNYEYKNSYTNKIMISVSREKWIYDEYKKITVKQKVKPYIKLYGSLHKFFLGHNVFGGSNNIKYQVNYLLLNIEADLELKNELPKYHEWYVNRIDYAKIYLLDSQKSVKAYFDNMRNVYYPRKDVLLYPGKSLYKGGRYTSVKLYNKYEEFKKHDYKFWKKYSSEADELLRFSEKVLRCEIEVKKNKLKYDFNTNGDIKLMNISIDYLENIFKLELKRLLNEGEEIMKIKNNNQVRMLLENVFIDDKEMFMKIYGFYNDLCINGEKVVKSGMAERTYYKYKSILKKYNINWINHDIVKSDNVTFNPLIAKDYDQDMILKVI